MDISVRQMGLAGCSPAVYDGFDGMSWQIVAVVSAALGVISIVIAGSAHLVVFALAAVVLFAVAAIAMLMLRRSRPT